MSLAVGPSKHSPGGYLEFGRYASGELAMLVKDEDGQVQLKATVSLVPYGADDPGEFGCWIKDWSENEGIADVLVRSGIVTLTGKTHSTGYVVAKHAELTEAAKADLKESGM